MTVNNISNPCRVIDVLPDDRYSVLIKRLTEVWTIDDVVNDGLTAITVESSSAPWVTSGIIINVDVFVRALADDIEIDCLAWASVSAVPSVVNNVGVGLLTDVNVETFVAGVMAALELSKYPLLLS